MVEAHANKMSRPECCVCMREYTTQGILIPVVLKCGHDLCNECADRLKIQATNEGKGSFSCPTCRVETETSFEPTKAFGLINMLERLEE